MSIISDLIPPTILHYGVGHIPVLSDGSQYSLL